MLMLDELSCGRPCATVWVGTDAAIMVAQVVVHVWRGCECLQMRSALRLVTYRYLKLVIKTTI